MEGPDQGVIVQSFSTHPSGPAHPSLWEVGRPRSKHQPDCDCSEPAPAWLFLPRGLNFCDVTKGLIPSR